MRGPVSAGLGGAGAIGPVTAGATVGGTGESPRVGVVFGTGARGSGGASGSFSGTAAGVGSAGGVGGGGGVGAVTAGGVGGGVGGGEIATTTFVTDGRPAVTE